MTFTSAWAALGGVVSGAVIRQMIPPAEGVRRARAAGLKAVELDPNLVEGHNLLGQIYMDWDKDFAAAKRELDVSRALNPKSARYWHFLGMWLGQQGQVEEALDAVRRARELEPMTPLYSGNYAVLLYVARRYDELIAFSRPLVEANPNFDQARAMLARGLMATGNLEGALAQLQARLVAGIGQADLGVLYAKMGRREDALLEIKNLEARGREGYGVAFDLALIHVALGELDQGCELLMRAITDYSVLVNWMRLDPRLDPLRGRQCFATAEQRLYGT
jgi:tetratricopeptide (TPR) repeat protein